MRQKDSVELKSVKKGEDGTAVNIETEGHAGDVKPGGTEKENDIKETDSDNEGILVEGGITYDDSDWVPAPSNTGKGDGSEDNTETFVGKSVLFVQRTLSRMYNAVNGISKGYFVDVVLVLGYTAFFVAAMLHERLQGEHSIRLLCATILFLIVKTRSYWMTALNDCLSSANKNSQMPRVRLAIRWFLYLGLFVLMGWVLVEQGMKDIRNIQPVPGLIVMMLVCLFVSTAPSKVNWHTIYWSVGLQFICGIFVLRTDFGENAMLWIQDRFNEYFANTQKGAEFLFGKTYKEHFIIFSAFPTFLFSNATLCLLYYVGAIQLVINAIGSFLEFVLDTSPIESTGVAGGIFLEGAMAFLALKPYLGRLTQSQLFLLTTSAYSSLGGAYLGMLAQLGVKVSDLIPAMLMSAPATFAVCKLMIPETGTKKRLKVDSSVNEQRQQSNNVLEVVQNGAVQILGLIGNIVAIIFVIYAFLSWINNTLGWFGDRVGVENFTIELIFSYLLYPVSLSMGIEFDDCKQIAAILGYRLGSGNIVAFRELGKMTDNRIKFEDYMNQTNNMGHWTQSRDDIIIGNETLVMGYVSERSERMITYAMCGFSSITSVGMNIGIVTTLVPRRKTWLSQLFMLSLVAGNIANCMTGAFAGIFYYD